MKIMGDKVIVLPEMEMSEENGGRVGLTLEREKERTMEGYVTAVLIDVPDRVCESCSN